MAYADQSMSSRRMVAIGFVILFHALIGYAFITGLAYNVVKKVAEDLKTFDVQEEPPPPPEEPPPPPPEQKFEPPPMVAPPPIVKSPIVVAPPVQTVQKAPVITIDAPPAPKPSIAKPPQPRGRPQNWLSTDDYPSSAIREGVEGVTGYRLDIGTDGRVAGCSVTSSSGSRILDDTTCRLLSRRARFTPAQDAAGNPIASSYSGRTRWQIPE
ncbi:MAG: energy transducer TonB [Sphingomonadaceae bacterium]